MQISTATFVNSSVQPKKALNPPKPTFAFIGRSNVGKSSLINSLLGRKKLAKTSSKPGKTQLINYFLVNKAWYLVDLPGYGWAKVSKAKRDQFQKTIANYLLYNPSLVTSFLLIDSRHTPQNIDLEFIQWLGSHQIPFSIVFTKTDKLSKRQVEKNQTALQQIMHKTWESLPVFFQTSAIKHQGGDEILTYIANYI
ncbi:MAG: ribosome biogenesis GTP-binding protein YihA/YsxC [Bacteroidota bacterium]